MKIKWLGHSSFKITLDNGRTIITDPFDDSVGYPMPGESADIVLSSHDHFDHNCFSAVSGDPEIINAPGSYERFGAAIHGVASFHDDARGAKRGTNVIFTVEADGVRLTHLGDLGHLPETPDQSAAIEGADVILIPIGGTFTITTLQAVQLIERFKPKAAVAMHFKNRFCGFPVSDEAEFVRLTGAKSLPNEAEIRPGALSGCYVMALPGD